MAHIMISYNWDHQVIAERIKAKLKEDGFRTWMDIDFMMGNMAERMAEAVENASVVLVFMSEQYENSRNCQGEAQYADLLQKPLIPIKV